MKSKQISLLEDMAEITSAQSGGSQQYIHKKVVDDSYLLIPHKQILEKFNLASKPIFKKISYNYFQLLKSIEIQKYLLSKLMSGELVN